MYNNVATDRDQATRNATAFRSWDALMTSVHRDGYYPTLRRNDLAQRRLGLLLEAERVRVFWIGKGASHAA
jgi:hypothetical protein